MQWSPPPAFSPWDPGALSLAVYTAMVLGLVALLLFLSGWLGEKKVTAEKLRPFEGGVIPTGPARLHDPAPFYLIAIFFLVFDVEALFIFAWAVVFHSLGWAGWLGISFFIAVLFMSLLYIWKERGLEWGPVRKHDPRGQV